MHSFNDKSYIHTTVHLLYSATDTTDNDKPKRSFILQQIAITARSFFV